MHGLPGLILSGRENQAFKSDPRIPEDPTLRGGVGSRGDQTGNMRADVLNAPMDSLQRRGLGCGARNVLQRNAQTALKRRRSINAVQLNSQRVLLNANRSLVTSPHARHDSVAEMRSTAADTLLSKSALVSVKLQPSSTHWALISRLSRM